MRTAPSTVFWRQPGRWCSGQVEESRILRPLCREGIAARSWKDSFLCRVLSALVNLPGTLLHAWYKAWNLTFEDSFFARLAFDMGDSASIAQSWCIAALWCIPYERWNNAYSFMTGVLLLLLFYAGAMRTGRRLDVARIGFYPALMLAAVTLAVTFSYAPGLSARFLIYHVSAALLVVITVSAVRNGEDLKRLCAGAAVCVGATGAYGIVQRIQGVKVNPSYVDLKVNAGMPGRVFSIFDNPNTFAPGAFAAAAAGAGPVPYGEALAMEGHLRRYLLRGRHGHGHDLFPGKLGGAGCRYGGIRVPLETEADPSLYSAVRTGGALPAHHGAEPHPHHYQYGGLLHLQPGVSLQGGH